MMQLLSQKYNRSITEYYPLYKGDSVESTIILPPIDFSRNYKKETSVFLKKLNDIKLLESLYIFKNPEEIKKFLLVYDYLIDYLFEAYDQIRGIWGENIEVYLEYDIDHEEEWDELFIVIKSLYPAEKAIELERKLFDEWFVHIMDKLNNKLNFTEEPL
jgi:hypothetical protein